ncbi:butyrophilin-like protein 10 [Discoglossus pictus]
MQHTFLNFRFFAVLIFCSGLNASTLEVTTYLYGSAELPCIFPFVSGSESLYVSWEKRDNLKIDKRNIPVVHMFQEGEDHNEHQDPAYKGRTELSKDISRGKLDLVLKNITYSDEGIYYCRAANLRGRGDIPVKLTINRLRTSDPSVIIINEKKRLKCFTIGIFREPQIEWMAWINGEMRDLSIHGHLSVTNLSNGTMWVESVLNYEAKTNVHYFCHIKEGRLKRRARAVISDGQSPVVITDDI